MGLAKLSSKEVGGRSRARANKRSNRRLKAVRASEYSSIVRRNFGNRRGDGQRLGPWRGSAASGESNGTYREEGEPEKETDKKMEKEKDIICLSFICLLFPLTLCPRITREKEKEKKEKKRRRRRDRRAKRKASSSLTQLSNIT